MDLKPTNFFHGEEMSDYHSMSLIELKHVAKNHTPKIKQYYVKSRAELIQILTMSEFTEEMVVAKKRIAQLREEAKERKLTGFWKMRRAELVELLYPSTKQDNKNNNSRKEHDDPQKCESEEVRVDMLKDSI